MEYAAILIGVLLISPFVLKLASSQKKEIKRQLRIIFLILLSYQILSGLLNWETFQGSGRSGFELALAYPNSYLWLFFAVAIVQAIILSLKKQTLYTLATVANFANTVIFFAAMIRVSNLLGQQIVSLASIGAIFAVLIGNVVGLVLINKDRNLLAKYT